MAMHLLVVGTSLHLVTNQSTGADGCTRLTVRPALRGGGTVRSIGYIGSFVAELVRVVSNKMLSLTPRLRSPCLH